jgi:hypothetical protein
MYQRIGGIEIADIGDLQEANMDNEDQHFGEEVC